VDSLVIVGVVALALCALALLVASRWRVWLLWWRSRRKPHRTRYPIVLVHGVLGFDELSLGGKRHEYFRGVEEHLRALGAEVHRPRLPPLASVAERAAALAAYVEALPARRVNVIAHSMGGIDARFAVARLGLAPKVASIITVGTPHRGTPLADVGSKLLAGTGVRQVAKVLGLVLDAFDDLTSQRVAALALADPRGVYCASVVARAPTQRGLNHLLLATHRYLRTTAGDNDGLVPTLSQAWGEVLCEIEADHWAQVGWGTGFDARALYADLARELKARGC
jgi:triacylglycerol lipase